MKSRASKKNRQSLKDKPFDCRVVRPFT